MPNLILDAGTASVIAATVTLGPPQAAPMAIKVLGRELGKILLVLAVGHLGSAMVIFIFFQAVKPVIDGLRAHLASLWVRLVGRRRAGEATRATSPFIRINPGQKYYFLGTVAFVFAFGSFLGVAATQAVGMRRSRAFAAVIAGCSLSVLFWGLAAYYLSRAMDPMFISLLFLAAALGAMWRGKILENRVVLELRNMGVDGLKALSLVAQELSPLEIARDMGLRLEELSALMARLQDGGYVALSRKELYEATTRGLERLNTLPEWLLSGILQERRRSDQ